jgi:hypothetical protein
MGQRSSQRVTMHSAHFSLMPTRSIFLMAIPCFMEKPDPTGLSIFVMLIVSTSIVYALYSKVHKGLGLSLGDYRVSTVSHVAQRRAGQRRHEANVAGLKRYWDIFWDMTYVIYKRYMYYESLIIAANIVGHLSYILTKLLRRREYWRAWPSVFVLFLRR